MSDDSIPYKKEREKNATSILKDGTLHDDRHVVSRATRQPLSDSSRKKQKAD